MQEHIAFIDFGNGMTITRNQSLASKPFNSR